MQRYRISIQAECSKNNDRRAIREHLMRLAREAWPGKGLRWTINTDYSTVYANKPMLKTWLELIMENPEIPVCITVIDDELEHGLPMLDHGVKGLAYVLQNCKEGKHAFRLRCHSIEGCCISIPLEYVKVKTVAAIMEGKAIVTEI